MKMQSTFLLLLFIGIAAARDARYESYWEEANQESYLEEQEQGYYEEEAELQQVCSIQLSPADQRIADSLEGARSLPQMPVNEFLARVPRTCEDGPNQIIHSIQNEFHVPYIPKGTCNGLSCSTDRCRVKRSQYKTKCVLVFRFINGLWTKIGFRNIRYLDHLDCQCKQCRHITNQRECVSTTSCPNGDNDRSFCYWMPFYTIEELTPIESQEVALEQQLDVAAPDKIPLPVGRCGCCSPKVCKPPLIFNRANCRCECPPGTRMQGGKCVGNCRNLSPNTCTLIYCQDNPNLLCQRTSPFSKDCFCPTCSHASTKTCSMTRCLEQPSKPACIINKETKRCDCPNCHHQTNPRACASTQCGSSPALNCRFSTAYNSCYCPYTGCRTVLPGK